MGVDESETVPGETDWSGMLKRLDAAEAALRSDDPYQRAAAHMARAAVYYELYEKTLLGPVNKAAYARAALMDETTAARIRFKHGIPTITPQTEATLLGLGVCGQCGREWQIGTDGACPSCPRVAFGPTPRTLQEATDWGRTAFTRPE
jgi:hypothetical protein